MIKLLTGLIAELATYDYRCGTGGLESLLVNVDDINGDPFRCGYGDGWGYGEGYEQGNGLTLND